MTQCPRDGEMEHSERLFRYFDYSDNDYSNCVAKYTVFNGVNFTLLTQRKHPWNVRKYNIRNKMLISKVFYK